MEIGSIKCVNNLVADLTPVTNDVQRNTLKFHQDGVTHVLTISAAEGFILDTFTRNASQQKYFPKYVIASSNAHIWNNANPDNQVSFSPDAKPNMSGIAFRPYDDIAAKARPANAGQVAAQAQCKAADPTMGGSASDNSDNHWFALDQFYTQCDAFFGLVETLKANGVTYGLRDIAAGYRAMLGRGTSAAIAGGRYAGGNARVDGVGLVQPLKYDPSSKRFMHAGPPISVP